MNTSVESKEKSRARSKAWYALNRETILARRRAARDKKGGLTAADRIRNRRSAAAYYARHREAILERRFMERRKETPEQLEERREYNREAAKRYRAYCHMRDDIR